MKKETLTFKGIAMDLETVAKERLKSIMEWRLAPTVPVVLVSILLIVFLQNAWGFLFAGFALAYTLYQLLRFILEYRKYRVKRNAIRSAVDRTDLCISLEKFSHKAAETVYEPHYLGAKRRVRKTVAYLYFMSGSKWRIPSVINHYSWSKENRIRTKGLENISLQGDEFYYISLPCDHNTCYVYPCKRFELDRDLIKNTTDQ